MSSLSNSIKKIISLGRAYESASGAVLLISFFFCFSFSHSSFSQDTLDISTIKDINPHEPLEVNGKLFSGIVVRKTKAGVIIDCETSVNGNKEGPAYYYYSSGKPKAKGIFVNNAREGYWTQWYENGKVAQEGSFVAGATHGFMKTYDIRNDIHVDGTYKNGRYHGFVVGYKTDGDTIAFGEYEMGYKVGPWIEFNLDSNKTGKVNYPTVAELMANMPAVVTSLDLYESGDLVYFGSIRYTGTERVLHENGQINYEKTYIDGWPMTWRSFHQNGKPFIEAQYLNGRANGKWLYYFDNSQMQQEQEFVNGLKHGIWYQYNQWSVMTDMWTYEHDLLNGLHTAWHWKDPNHKATEEYYVNGKLHGRSKHFYEDGIMKDDLEYSAGILDGVSYYYNKKGIPSQVVTYRQGQRIEVADFYEDGVNKSIIQFADDKPAGVYKEWFLDGKLSVAGQHLDGFRSGTWNFYYADTDSVEFVSEYLVDKVVSCKMLRKNNYRIFADRVGKPDLQKIISACSQALENGTSIDQFFATEVFVYDASTRKMNKVNKEPLLKPDGFFGTNVRLFLEGSLKTGLSSVAKNDSLNQSLLIPMVSTYGFSSLSIKQAFIDNLLALPKEKSFKIYENPDAASKLLAETDGYCFTIDMYCADNSLDGKCWYSLGYGGKTAYVDRNELLHCATLREFIFGFSDGTWKIVAIR